MKTGGPVTDRKSVRPFLGGNKGGTASFRPFMDESFYFFMAFHGGFYTIRINILKKKQKQEERNHERVGKKF